MKFTLQSQIFWLGDIKLSKQAVFTLNFFLRAANGCAGALFATNGRWKSSQI